MSKPVLIIVLEVLVVFMVSVDTASVRRYERPRRENSATYLRLTALRTDEGVWTAKFGDYEISIELRHHPRYPNDRDYNDTWTLKVKHTSKRYVLPEDKENDVIENEIIGDILDEPSIHTSETKDTWKEIIDGMDDADEDDDVPTLKKNHQPRKVKKVKTRRQLSTKSLSSTTEKNDFADESESESSRKQFVMKELAQGSTRINVAFDSDETKTKPKQQEDDMQEMNENSWNNIAAVIYDGIPNTSLTSSSAADADEQESYSHLPEKLTDVIALPLQQPLNQDDYDNQKAPSLDQDMAVPQNFNPETWKLPEDVIVDNADKETSSKASEENTEGHHEDSTNEDERTEESDYVIEDPTVRGYNGEEEEEDESESESSEVDLSDLEVPVEMKRIMEWFPKSRPLTLENNGYKLFPGVGWFKLVPWAERWSNARKACEAEMAHLAVPDSLEKVKIFLQIFKNYPDVLEKSILNNQVFVGVHNVGSPAHFTTVQGDTFSPEFPIWFEGEPDNADPGEDCVTFHAEGRIRDVPCFYNLPFLCEKEPDIS